MKGDPNPELSAEEFQSLCDLTIVLLQPRIPAKHADLLIKLGYAAHELHHLQITDAGKMRIIWGR